MKLTTRLSIVLGATVLAVGPVTACDGRAGVTAPPPASDSTSPSPTTLLTSPPATTSPTSSRPPMPIVPTGG